jgi:5-methylcytosine-specific restriction endonuclease McrA
MSYKLKLSETLGEVNLSIGLLPIKELEFYGKIEHRRLKVFHAQGTKCVNPECGRVGTKLMVNEVTYKKGSKHIHVDVFTEDNILMTVDHIIPKCKGGAVEDMSNLQIMCTRCNTKKGDKML